MSKVHEKIVGGKVAQIGVFDSEGKEWWVCPTLWAIVENPQQWLETLKSKGAVSPVVEFSSAAA